MSLEAKIDNLNTKLDAALTGVAGVQSSIASLAAAIQSQPGTNNDAVLAAIAKTESEIEALSAVVGTEAPATVAASSASGSSASGAASK